METDDTRCEQCGPELARADGSMLRVRHAVQDDRSGLERLYEELSDRDRQFRFFRPMTPGSGFYDRWLTIEDDGGVLLVVERLTGNGAEIVGDAGLAPTSSGGLELGIALSSRVRGGLGHELLDRLFAHARARGVDRVDAVVRANNAAMLGLARRRGFAVTGHPEWGCVQLTMPTTGDVPVWSTSGRPRVLIESERTRWFAEAQLEEREVEWAICTAMAGSGEHCPIRRGESCALRDDADVVVSDLRPDRPPEPAGRTDDPRLPPIEVWFGDGERTIRRSTAEILTSIDERLAHRAAATR